LVHIQWDILRVNHFFYVIDPQKTPSAGAILINLKAVIIFQDGGHPYVKK